MSWKRALDTIDSRTGSCANSRDGTLRYWKEVIEKAYLDLQANLLRCRPSLLTSLALSEDGRTEDSGFPNLLLPAEREPYGL